MCNSTTDIRVEALNGIQPSPDLSMSSAGWATSLPTGFNNDLQGSTSNSDDQSTVRTLPDNDIDDATLNLDADQNGIHDLPLQPADVGNLGYETAISWQPLGKDNFTDWPLDFDMPDFDMLFPVDQLNQSTGVDAATMTELDKPQPWDQSTRSYNPTSSSGELMGYLSLNEAVSIRTALWRADIIQAHAILPLKPQIPLHIPIFFTIRGLCHPFLHANSHICHGADGCCNGSRTSPLYSITLILLNILNFREAALGK